MRKWEYVFFAIPAILVATGVIMMMDGSVVGDRPDRTGMASLVGVMGIFMWLWVSRRVVTQKAKAKKSPPLAR